jgi:hypothetical protein
MTRDEWLELSARCEKATGPNREIDAAIMAALGGFRVTAESQAVSIWEMRKAATARAHGPMVLGNLSSSLDAITALIERELPEAEFNSTGKVQGDGVGGLKRYAYAWLVIGPRQYGGVVVASEALGRCATFCRAMAERTAP